MQTKQVFISSTFAIQINSSFGFCCLMGRRGQKIKSRATQGEEYKVRPYINLCPLRATLRQ